MHLPSYIHPQNLIWSGIEPPSISRSDTVLGIYYNVLCPQERDAEPRQKLYRWITAMDPFAPFPLANEELFLFSSSTCKGIAKKAFYGQFAQKLLEFVEAGLPFENALLTSLDDLKGTFASTYDQMSKILQQREKQASLISLKMRFGLLADSFESCSKHPEEALSYAIEKYQAIKNEPEKLIALLKGSIDKGSGQKLRELDQWNFRKKPLFQMINETLSLYPKSPFFLALQEVTVESLFDFKQALKHQKIQWVSFNNISGKETTVITPENESVLGESGSHTATIGLSSDLQIERVELGSLPNCSATPRTLLGVEVKNKNTGGHFAIFSIHTDYLIQEDLYLKNIEAITSFIGEFTHGGELPFIMGGDLNAFEGMGGAIYIENLKSKMSFKSIVDYREGDFYSPKQIIDATFIGHQRDDYKMFIDCDGRVEPNALDHIFMSWSPLLSFRKAGVYDEFGKLLNPIEDPDKFKENMLKRNTVSDHFMNGVLFTSS